MKALVTGATQGLGRALTDALLDDGHEVLAVDIDTAPLDDLAIRSRGACKARLVDLSNTASLERLLDAIIGETFDLVILNAGISATGKFEDIPVAAYEKLISVNMTAPIVLAGGLVSRGNMAPKGKIVFISSLSDVTGYPGASVYAATKTGIATWARGARRPLKREGVSLLTVFPGPIRTRHAERHAPPGAKESRRMPPDKLARIILKAARGKTRELFPGSAAGLAKQFGSLFPNLATRAMRRAIYDKLDRTEY